MSCVSPCIGSRSALIKSKVRLHSLLVLLESLLLQGSNRVGVGIVSSVELLGLLGSHLVRVDGGRERLLRLRKLGLQGLELHLLLGGQHRLEVRVNFFLLDQLLGHEEGDFFDQGVFCEGLGFDV